MFDFGWLLQEMQDGAVVPIIGSELYAGPDGAGYELRIAAALAAELKMPSPLPTATPREVVLAYQVMNGSPVAIKGALKAAFHAVVKEPPKPILQLAQITDFNLYVTTALDHLLEDALAHVGRPAKSFAHSLTVRRGDELPDIRKSNFASVYHVLGRFADACAVSDANVLEFIAALMSETRRPTRLFDELAGRNLLFLGCGFPDWLLRLFIRVIKDAPFSREDARPQVIADARIAADAKLGDFLRGHQLMLYPPGTATTFVRELHEAWSKQRSVPAARFPVDPGHVLADGAVFLSFSSEDRDVVRPIAHALEAAGIDVFFDELDLHPGDEWDHVIRDNVRRAELFVAFVSERTERLGEARKYFWREWNAANRQADSFAPDATYIIPVGLDRNLDPERASVPDAFRTKQWFWLTEPTNQAEFVNYVQTTYRDKQRRRHGRSGQ
jgi:TIR domain/SIR2-like domain